MMWDYNGWWGMAWGLHMLVPLAVLGLVVWAAASMIRSGSRQVGDSGPPALSILKERYARGQLNREQYEIMRQDIT